MFTLEQFEQFKTYREGNGQYDVIASEPFAPEVIDIVSRAIVTKSGEYPDTLSVALFLKAGGRKFIGLSIASRLGVGDSVSIEKGRILTLKHKTTGAIIYRFEEF